MDYIFTYGTLQDLQVQSHIFGKTLKGRPDSLLGFKKIENVVYGRYPLVVKTKKSEDWVHGMVYEVTSSELGKADIYETTAYTRKKFALKSGIEAWVYIENSK